MRVVQSKFTPKPPILFKLGGAPVLDPPLMNVLYRGILLIKFGLHWSTVMEIKQD